MDAKEVISRFTGVKNTGSGYKALCPAHEDKNPSLSIKESGSRILVHCHAGCSPEEIVAAVGLEMKDLFFETRQIDSADTNHAHKPQKVSTIAKTYPYRDKNGLILYENVRFDPKDFKQRRPDGNGGYHFNLNGVRRVPYRLPELIEAVKNDVTIWLTEGEKDADNLDDLGLTASSFKNWTRDFNKYFKDAQIVLLTDHDKSGMMQANKACAILSEHVSSLKLLDLFEKEPLTEDSGSDVSNWIEIEKQNGTSGEEIAERLCVLVDNIEEWGIGDYKGSDQIKNNLPTPLPESSLSVPPLTHEMLPEPWREWLADISERMQCPLDYPSIAAIVAASALIGSRIRVKPKQKDNWFVTANLWGAVVGSPSLLKSPAVTEGLFFFREIEDKERQSFDESRKKFEFESAFAKEKLTALKGKMKKKEADKAELRREYESLEIEEPIEKRLSTTDATVEKLGELLNENENGILLGRDELTGWFRSLERAGREQDRSFYLECWDGGGYFTVDRIGRGTVHIKNLTVSVLGTIQPAMLEPYLRGALEGYGDDGLIQRFQLMVYPQKPKNYKYVDAVPKGRDQARETFKGLHSLDPTGIGAKRLADEYGGGYFVQFDNEAQEFFIDWLTKLELDLRSDTFDTLAFESHVAKYRSLLPSLALIFHLLDCITGTQSTSISLDNTRLAAKWCTYLMGHAEKIYQIATMSEFDVAREILKKVEEGKIENGFTARDIYKNHWAKLSKPKLVNNGLEILEDYGYLTSEYLKEGHRPKKVYYVHESLI